MIPPVVDTAWLARHHDPARVVLADVRWYLDGRSGREAHDRGHLPGAVFVDLDRWLAAPGGPASGRHPLPAPEIFAEGMGQLGIGDDDVVIAHDDAGGVIAARLVWMLRATGHEAALLDGGLAAGLADPAITPDGQPETTAVQRPAAVFTPRAWPADRLADIDAAAAAPASGVLLDARTGDRYRGESEPVDPRAGHVPGARNLSCRDHVAPDGRLLPVEALRERFAAVGVAEGPAGASGPDVVAYCGSGVTACHDLVVMEHAGLGLGRLFPGSWSQWSHDTTRPVATGPDA